WGALGRTGNRDIVASDHNGTELWRHGASPGADMGLVAALDDFVLLYEFTHREPADENDAYRAPVPQLIVLDAQTGEETDREELALDAGNLVYDGRALWGREWRYDPREPASLVRLDAAADAGQLELAWRLPAGYGRLVLDGDRLIDLGASSFAVRDAQDGSVRDLVDLPRVSGGAPVLTGGSLIFDDGDRRVIAIDLGGNPRWTTELDSPIIADPVAAGDRLYIATARGSVEVLDVGSGEVTTGVQLSSDPASSATLLAARGVLIARFDTSLWAIGGPGGPTGRPSPPPAEGILEVP
ncbi:MAG: PQQ-binding-like beta-propeller repeat protein, partial [Nitriliruptorales bacterium]|nr:PQQ-binding-like beta-propeller repeat protein [Nitriliruptorales bacterium]